MDHTFAFADLAGFTALTEAHGDQRAANAASDFYAEIAQRLPQKTAEIVKPLGDAVMLRFDSALDAVDSCIAIAESALRSHGSLAVRIGVHRGPAVERDGDWFGAAVNVAARIAAVARGGEVLISSTVLGELPAERVTDWEDAGVQTFKNVSAPQRLYVMRVGAAETELSSDPVCHMSVDPARAAGRLIYEDETFYFCSLKCAGTFAAQPAAFHPGPRVSGVRPQ